MGFLNLGPAELGVLVIVALIVFGPDRLPTLARDAARMVKTLRELAQGARTQLRDELGPELGNLDLTSLNPRTALRRALLDDEEDSSPTTGSTSSAPLPPSSATPSATTPFPTTPSPTTPEPRPLAPGEQAPFDGDAT